jgi:hypothetical protein
LYNRAVPGPLNKPAASNRAFKALLILSLCYFAGLIAFQILKIRDTNRLIDNARGLPAWDPYTIDFWTHILAYPLMTLVALFPVLAALRGLYRRNPQGFIIVYALLQVLLIVIHWVAATNLVRHGYFSYSKGLATYKFVVFKTVLRSIPKYHVLFSLPLLLLPLLLVRRVRQAFS